MALALALPLALALALALAAYGQPQDPGTSWNEELERGNELERGAGTRIQLERAGKTGWNEDPIGTMIAERGGTRILDCVVSGYLGPGPGERGYRILT